ncbi:glucosyltransferase [Oceaniferula spumae]|uniref:Glucosyltransferase n=1 Tax=Oceaniferula spumae TaxID=2979115 RepID=A0AAT9FRA9_9BACT
MKVVLMLQFYFPFGGLQRDCVKMAGLLAANGHEVTILTRSWEGETPEEVEVQVLGARGLSNVAMDQNFDQDAAAWLNTKVVNAVIGFSRMETTMDFYYAADPCYRLRIERDRSLFYRLSRKFRYYAGLEQKLFEAGGDTHLLLLTGMEVPEYVARYGTEESRITVLPPGIRKRELLMDAKLEIRAKVRADMGWPDDLPVVLFVGSGFATKGLDRAIRACGAMPGRVKFVVAGDGKTGKYQQLAKQVGVGDKVDFLGARDDAWELMVAADLMIHPARSENTGTVLVEALSAGTGVLTTDRCGFANHVTSSGSGHVLVSPFDQDALNHSLERMISEPWQQRAEKALLYAETEDLYSGMDAGVRQIEMFLANGGRVGS